MLDNSSPLVTFALITYNQVGFIEGAVNAALAQEYSNLQIIISDDCSQDGTFQLVESLLENYSGQHKVKINQTSENKCTLGHVFEVIDLADGELILFAAGDDISRPERTSEIVSIWQKEQAAGIFSNYGLINDEGIINDKLYNPSKDSVVSAEVFGRFDRPTIHGASSAYDLVFLRSLPRPVGRFYFEDIFMGFMIDFFNKNLVKVNKPLVLYRQHSDSISNSSYIASSFKDIKVAQEKSSTYALNKYDLYVFLRDYTKSFSKNDIPNNFNSIALDEYIDKLKVEAMWIDSSSLSRIYNTFKYRKDREFTRWILPRVFGINIFCALRISPLYNFF